MEYSELWPKFDHRVKIVLLVMAACLFLVVLLRNAWLADDAYITFRTIDNFVNGYGLTWNAAERVQTFTHPGWLFVITPLYFVTGEFYFSVIGLSLLITLLTVILVLPAIARSVAVTLLGIVILISSKAFVDYSTSGLENPLTHLLFGLFLLLYLKETALTFKKLFLLSLLAGLAAFTRMDTVLLYLPALVYALFKFRCWQGLLAVGAGFLPFILWECFSLFYYGFLFPNTAYAKLGMSVSRFELVQQGLLYLLNSISLDPLTLLFIGAGISAPLMLKQTKSIPVVCGILLYLIYIVSIGGDFMSGRFLTAPLLGAVILLVSLDSKILSAIALPASLVILLFGLVWPYSPLKSTVDYAGRPPANGVIDERGTYYKDAGLLTMKRYAPPPTSPWADQGRLARFHAPCVATRTTIGFFGFVAGPEVHIIDTLALGDALLARLPAIYPFWEWAGHYDRPLPHGYLETVGSGHNQISDENLALFYDKLHLITTGNLTDPARWQAIVAMNLGRYDSLLQSFSPHLYIDGANAGSVSWQTVAGLHHYNGLKIDLGQRRHTKALQVTLAKSEFAIEELPPSLDSQYLCPGGDTDESPPEGSPIVVYRLTYLDGAYPVGTQDIAVPMQVSVEATIERVDVPEQIMVHGFDSIILVTLGEYFVDPVLYNVQQLTFIE